MAEERIAERLKKELERLSKEGMERLNKLLEGAGTLWKKWTAGAEGAEKVSKSLTGRIVDLTKKSELLRDVLLTGLLIVIEKVSKAIANVLSPNVEALTLGFNKNEESVSRLQQQVTRLAHAFERGQQQAIRPFRDMLASTLSVLVGWNEPMAEAIGYLMQLASNLFSAVAALAKLGVIAITVVGTFKLLAAALGVVGIGFATMIAPITTILGLLALLTFGFHKLYGGMKEGAGTFEAEITRMKEGSEAAKRLAEDLEVLEKKLRNQRDAAAASVQINDALARGDVGRAASLQAVVDLRDRELREMQESLTLERQLKDAGAQITEAVRERLRLRQQQKHEQDAELAQIQAAQRADALRQRVLERNVQLMELAVQLLQKRAELGQVNAEGNLAALSRGLQVAEATNASTEKLLGIQAKIVEEMRKQHEASVQIAALELKASAARLAALKEDRDSRPPISDAAREEQLAKIDNERARVTEALAAHRERLANATKEELKSGEGIIGVLQGRVSIGQTLNALTKEQKDGVKAIVDTLEGRLAGLEAKRGDILERSSAEFKHQFDLKSKQLAVGRSELDVARQRLEILQRENPLQQKLVDLERERLSLIEKEKQQRVGVQRAEETLARARETFDPERAFQRARSRFVAAAAGTSPADQDVARAQLEDMARLAQEVGDERLMEIAARANLRFQRSGLSRTQSDRSRIESLQGDVSEDLKEMSKEAGALREKSGNVSAAPSNLPRASCLWVDRPPVFRRVRAGSSLRRRSTRTRP
jgi:hypothetical protein